MQKNNRLENLPAAQRQQLLNWLDKMTYDTVVERLALPPPDGFDLQTSRSALGRFRQKAHLHEFLEHHDEASAQARSVNETVGDPQAVEDAAVALLRQRLFSAAVQPSHSTQELARLFSILLKLKRANREERKLQISGEKRGEHPDVAHAKSEFLEAVKRDYEAHGLPTTPVPI